MQTTVIICATLIAIVVFPKLIDLLGWILFGLMCAVGWMFVYLIEAGKYVARKFKRKPNVSKPEITRIPEATKGASIGNRKPAQITVEQIASDIRHLAAHALEHNVDIDLDYGTGQTVSITGGIGKLQIKAASTNPSSPSSSNPKDQACPGEKSDTLDQDSGAVDKCSCLIDDICEACDERPTGGPAADDRETILRVGDTVYHRSIPSREMTITGFYRPLNQVRCSWYDSERAYPNPANAHRMMYFDPNHLIPVMSKARVS